MLLSQIIFFSILFLFIYVLIILRRSYRKISTILLVLLLVLFSVSLTGAIKFSFEI